MKALILYSIKNILRNSWKKWLVVLIMFVETIKVYYESFEICNKEQLSSTPLNGLLWAILILSSGIIQMDDKKGFLDILFSKPISKLTYIFSKYIGLLAVIIVWDILNIFYLNLISKILQDKGFSIVCSFENFIFHLLDIFLIPLFIILISTLFAKGIDLIIFLGVMVLGDMVQLTDKILPHWFGQYFLSMRFSKNLFNLSNNIDDNWLLFYLGSFFIFALSAFFSIFILKRKVEY